MSPRVLVAGVGNVFLRDDGFGVELAQRLRAEPLPEGVEVADYGIRSLHLAFALLEPLELLVVADALPRGGAPGMLYVLEPDVDAGPPPVGADAHGMNLSSVFTAVRTMGGVLPRVRILGCEPADVGEGLGLSAQVASALGPAVELVQEVLRRELALTAGPAPARMPARLPQGPGRTDARRLPGAAKGPDCEE